MLAAHGGWQRRARSGSLWQGALVGTLTSGVAVYDTLFVEPAVGEGLLLATFDRKVLKGCPNIASRPNTLIAR